MVNPQFVRLSPLGYALRLGAASLLLACAVSLAASAQVDCSNVAEYRALDFLVGDWEVSSSDGARLGESTIEVGQQGCVLTESWRGSLGDTAETMTYIDPATGRWHQLSVSSQGRVLKLEGELASDGRLDLVGELSASDGATPVRGVVSRVSGGFDETLEISTDGGSTFEPLLEIRYREVGRSRVTQKSRPEPAATEPAAEPTPTAVRSPERARPAPIVESRSRRVDREDAIIDVESPMVLEIELGPVEKTRPGYGWISSETERYRTAGAVISKVQVSRRDRKSSTFVEVTVSLRSEARSERYEVEVALLEPETSGNPAPLVSEIQKIPAGKGIPSQMQYGAVDKDYSLELAREEFEQLFSNSEARPRLRLTLTAP